MVWTFNVIKQGGVFEANRIQEKKIGVLRLIARIGKRQKEILCICIILQVASIVMLSARVIYEKRHVSVVSPDLAMWEPRNGIYDGGWQVDEESFDEGSEPIDFLYGPYMPLEKGSYVFRINYLCDSNQRCYVHAYENEERLPDKSYSMPARKSEIKGYFAVKNDIENAEIRISYNGNGRLQIKSISVATSSHETIKQILILL